MGGEDPLRSAFAAILLLLVAACGAAVPAPRPARFTLVEKGDYQALYGPEGRLERLVHDTDGDRRADLVTFYAPSGRPLRAEADLDHDGRVDRWEHYEEDGRLRKVGESRFGRDQPDVFSYRDAGGAVSRREYDDDGDARVDRIEHFVEGRLVAEDLDLDADGRCERRLVKDASGRARRVETDRDGDGIFESRVTLGRGPL
jgi:hypothetical protein